MKRTWYRPDEAVPAVAKAIRILDCVAQDPAHGWTLGELTERLRIPKSSVYRILLTLEEAGLLVKEAGSGGHYHLGPTINRWASRYVPEMRYRSLIRPVLERLSDETGEAVQAATLDGHSAVVIDQIDSRFMVRAVSWVGRRSPLHCSSLGKALLATAPESFVDQYLSARLERVTAMTITDPAAIRAALAEVRRSGYAMDRGELEEGLWCIGVPVRMGDCALAISISAPGARMARHRDRVVRLLLDAARELQDEAAHDAPAHVEAVGSPTPRTKPPR
jgi:DNA-binding IclR family transcriptional regulator